MTTLAVQRGLHLQLLLDFPPDVQTRFASLRFPGQIRHLLDRTQMLLRCMMTLQTPPHRQRLIMTHDRHLIDQAMAGDTGNPFVHMHRMIEVGILRQFVYPLPSHGFARLITFPDQGQQRTIPFHVRLTRIVTVHADLSTGHGGVRRMKDMLVTVCAVHP